MEEVVLMSVPYTGTNFTAGLFISRGYQRIGMLDAPGNSDCVYVAHMIKDEQIFPAVELAKTRPLVCPFRHPFKAEESARRLNRPVSNIIKAYQNFFRVFLPLNPFIIPVDSPRRGEYLSRMSESMGIPFKTDWEPAGVKTGTWDMDMSEFSPSESIIQLVQEQHQFLSTLYDV